MEQELTMEGMPMAKRLSERTIAATDGYRVVIDPAVALLHVKTMGRWDRRITKEFGDSLSAAAMALAAAGVPIGTFRTLVDVRLGEIVPQDLVEIIGTAVARHGKLSERVAFLSASTIQKLQFRRILPDREFGHFMDEVEARAWLLQK